MTSTTATTTSIFTRKMDLFYLVFFMMHLPVVIFIDSQDFWPQGWIFPFMKSIRAYYVETYKDKFFIDPPSWFPMYIATEALYHIPLSIYAIHGLSSTQTPNLALHLLVYAVQTGVTTATCLAEMLSWAHLTTTEQGNLLGLYAPYLAVSVIMGIDMFRRLSRSLGVQASGMELKKTS